MSGLASFHPTCVGLPTYPSRAGGAEVYVRPFRVSGQTGQPSLGEGKWQVSKDRGNWPEWRADREIVFNTAPMEPHFLPRQ